VHELTTHTARERIEDDVKTAIRLTMATTLLASMVVLTLGGVAATGAAAASSSKVLLVGTFNGHKGQYSTIQSAVEAAKPGSWILVAPGDYHETDDSGPPENAHQGYFGGVVMERSNVHLRGMNRSTVIVDGTKAGSSTPCSSAQSAQNFGYTPKGKQPVGRNGIVVWKANNVTVENLTACNFLAGTGASGNEIWWNGGADSGKIGAAKYGGSYLTATSTYYGGEKTAAQYGIFSSNTAGPGGWYQVYASNFNDSGMYVGACQRVCNMIIDQAWMEYNALGYSGTNSGGTMIIEHSQFDNNEDGFDTNTQINGDPPAPQNGACLGRKVSPITHTHSCWVFTHNYVHDNNNPNVPAAGSAAAGPVGTGMTLSGGRNDTVMNNVFANNGAWGTLFVPYPDSGPAENHQSCKKTGGVQTKGIGCVYDPMNDALLNNTYTNNGFFGNPSNGDYGQIVFNSRPQPQNCYSGNTAPNGSTPSNLEQTQPVCGKLTTGANTGGPLLGQVLCETGFGSCPAGASYPKATGVVMHPLPNNLPTMPNPCAGVPANAWCKSGKPV
jgi:hypothetical protein